MSRLFATEAFSVLHLFLSFVKAHGVYVHSVWISFLPWKESFVRCICLWVICLCPSHYSLHFPPLMVEFCSPFVPVINFLWGFSRVMIRRCKGNPSVSRKKSMITGDDLSSLDSDTNILNFAMCSLIESSFFVCNSFILSRASPGELYGANASCRSCLNCA